MIQYSSENDHPFYPFLTAFQTHKLDNRRKPFFCNDRQGCRQWCRLTRYEIHHAPHRLGQWMEYQLVIYMSCGCGVTHIIYGPKALISGKIHYKRGRYIHARLRGKPRSPKGWDY